MSSTNWPVVGGGSQYWKDPVADFASLPASGNVGEIRATLDTDNLYEWNGSTWQLLLNSSGTVIGPASATDNALARFDGTTGKILQNSLVTVDDAGGLSAPALNGPLTGAVTGNVTGNLTGNVTGNVTGNLTGNVTGNVTGSVTGAASLNVLKAGDTMGGPLVLPSDPTLALQAATKQYVDSVGAGLDVKASVVCATTANITLSGEQTLDGILTSTSRVLVKNQTAPAENGIYVSAAGAWARSTDMDAWVEVPGAFCFVETGTLYADCAFVCSANAGGTIGVTAITWSQFAGAGTYTAGQGLTLTGTSFAITALTVSRAVATDGSGNPVAATTTATELGYVNGVTSAIQTQLNTKLAADVNGNLAGINSFIDGFATTASAAGTTTLVVGSKKIQQITGSSGQTIQMPVVNTLVLGMEYFIINSQTGGQTIDMRSSGNNSLGTINAGNCMLLKCILITGTGTASWYVRQIKTTWGIADGGTNVTSVTTTPTGSAFAGWDANANMSANNFLNGYTTTATAAGTTTLTVSSTYDQYFTGATTQICKLPVASTLALGCKFRIVNNSTGLVTVNSSGSNAVQVMAAGSIAIVSCILTSGTTAASWEVQYVCPEYVTTSLVVVSSNVTLTDKGIHLVDTSSARSLAFPNPATCKIFTIKDKTGTCSTNNITLTRFASEKIENVAASYVLDSDYGAWDFVSDGTDFWLI